MFYVHTERTRFSYSGAKKQRHLHYKSPLCSQKRHSTAGTLIMHKARDVSLRSDKQALETRCYRRCSVTRAPLVPFGNPHNRSKETVISRVRLDGALSQSFRMSLRHKNEGHLVRELSP